MTLHYDTDLLLPYVNWAYFYHAWQLTDGGMQASIRREAEAFLSSIRGRYQAHAVFQLFEAYAEGDDICLPQTPPQGRGFVRLPMLRQQEVGSDYLCLADFIPPKDCNSFIAPKDYRPSVLSKRPSLREGEGVGRFGVGGQVGLFSTTVDERMVTDFDSDPYERMMAQLVADRLAEAAAERLHEEVRKKYWGYAADEQLSIAEMLQGHFQGIRPAVGYPSLPDTSLNFLIDELIDMRQIGIRLTETGAMRPHASVSGLMISHPEARYFSVGKIGDDQLRDYARRRGLPVDKVRTFLAANI